MKKSIKHSEETRRKISEAMKGRKRSEETRKKMSEAKTGENHPNFGKHFSEEHRNKISESCKKSFEGRKRFFSEEHRKKLSDAKTGVKRSDEFRRNMSGENHHNWQGGISGWRTVLMNSAAYKAWRNAVYKRDNYTCQLCGERNGNLQAHHIQPVRDHKNDLLIFDINNGITLCKDCHKPTMRHEYEFIDQFNDILGVK